MKYQINIHNIRLKYEKKNVRNYKILAEIVSQNFSVHNNYHKYKIKFVCFLLFQFNVHNNILLTFADKIFLNIYNLFVV